MKGTRPEELAVGGTTPHINAGSKGLIPAKGCCAVKLIFIGVENESHAGEGRVSKFWQTSTVSYTSESPALES